MTAPPQHPPVARYRLHCGCLSGGEHLVSCPTVLGYLARLRAEPAPPPAAADDGLRVRVVAAIVAYQAAYWQGSRNGDMRQAMAAALSAGDATLRAEIEAKTAEIARLQNKQRELHRRVQKAEGFRDRHKRTMAYVWRRRIEIGQQCRAAESRATRAEAALASAVEAENEACAVHLTHLADACIERDAPGDRICAKHYYGAAIELRARRASSTLAAIKG